LHASGSRKVVQSGGNVGSVEGAEVVNGGKWGGNLSVGMRGRVWIEGRKQQSVGWEEREVDYRSNDTATSDLYALKTHKTLAAVAGDLITV